MTREIRMAPTGAMNMVRSGETVTGESVDSDHGKDSLYSAGDVARLFNIPESRLRYWSHTGFIMPSVRRDSRRFYCFQDLISVKVAKELLDEGQPLQRVRRSLDALRSKLPQVEAPLARLRIRSEQGKIVVDEGGTTFEATTGQMFLDFDIDALRDQVAEVLHLPWVEDEPSSVCAYDLFLEAQELESRWDGARFDDPLIVEARQVYRRAVELDPSFAAAWNNLGSLAAQAGELDSARDYFDEALQSDPEQPEAQCNLAELALREGDTELAITGFRQVLIADPDYAEAHYGLARSLLAVGGRGQALVHLERFCVALDRLAGEGLDDEVAERRAKAQEVVRALRRELQG